MFETEIGHFESWRSLLISKKMLIACWYCWTCVYDPTMEEHDKTCITW